MFPRIIKMVSVRRLSPDHRAENLLPDYYNRYDHRAVFHFAIRLPTGHAAPERTVTCGDCGLAPILEIAPIGGSGIAVGWTAAAEAKTASRKSIVLMV
jgi:hypothetical protein